MGFTTHALCVFCVVTASWMLAGLAADHGNDILSRSNNLESLTTTNLTEPGNSSRVSRSPRKSVVGHTLASSYFTSSAWINTIKSVAVCWAIVAFIWIFFRVAAWASFGFRLWNLKRARAAASSEMCLLERGGLSGVESSAIHALLSSSTPGKGTRTSLVTLPPGYENFSPPSYEEVVGSGGDWLPSLKTENEQTHQVPSALL